MNSKNYEGNYLCQMSSCALSVASAVALNPRPHSVGTRQPLPFTLDRGEKLVDGLPKAFGIRNLLASLSYRGPYALARPPFGRRSLSASIGHEQRLLANITKRVRLWNEMEPFYRRRQFGRLLRVPEFIESESAVAAVPYELRLVWRQPAKGQS